MAKIPAFDQTLLKRAERWVLVLVGLTVTGMLTGVVLTSSRSLGEHIDNFPWAAVGWLMVATVIESILRFWRYHTACKALNLPIPFWRLMFYYSVGYALLPTPGKVGTLIRLWLIKIHHHLPYRRTAPIFIMDLISDAVAMCALGALGLMILDHPVLQTLGWLVLTGLVLSVASIFVAPWILVAVVEGLYKFGGRKRARMFVKIRRMITDTKQVLGGRVLFITISQSFVGWAIVGFAVGHLLTAMGSPLSVVEGSIVISIGTMGGFFSMMPAGVGGAEATMGFLLGQFGVPLATIILAVALIRLAVLWFCVAIGLALLPFALRGAPKA